MFGGLLHPHPFSNFYALVHARPSSSMKTALVRHEIFTLAINLLTKHTLHLVTSYHNPYTDLLCGSA